MLNLRPRLGRDLFDYLTSFERTKICDRYLFGFNQSDHFVVLLHLSGLLGSYFTNSIARSEDFAWTPTFGKKEDFETI